MGGYPDAVSWLVSLSWDRIIEVASIAVAAAAAVGALLVGRSASKAAGKAAEAAEREARTAGEALQSARRQAILATVPFLKVADPTPLGESIGLTVTPNGATANWRNPRRWAALATPDRR